MNFLRTAIAECPILLKGRMLRPHSVIEYLSLLILHIAVLFALRHVLFFLGMIHGLADNNHLLFWDAGWYESVYRNGYQFTQGEFSNVAFYPLFPFIWSLFNFSPREVSVMNFVLFSSGLLLIARTYRVDRATFMILLSIPSLFFCYVPFSESLFFASIALFIFGFKTGSPLCYLGIFLACMTRSVSVIFVPIIIAVTSYNIRNTNDLKKSVLPAAKLLLTAIFAQALVALIQYFQTGQFTDMSDVQKVWGREFRLPDFYLTTWGRVELVWLDGTAFLTGVISITLCILLFVRKLLNTKKNHDAMVLFSLSYLSIVVLISLFYTPGDELGGTSLLSLNRYVFASPFFTVFLIAVYKYIKLNYKVLVLFTIVSAVVWSVFGLFANTSGTTNNLPTKMYFLIVFLYSSCFLLMADRRIRSASWSGIYLFNLVLQLYLFSRYIQFQWVG